MAKLLKLRRGTTTQHGSFTGAEGEVTVDTDKETLVVHDGSTAGGHPVAAENLANVSSSTIAGRLANDSIAVSKIAAGTLPSDVKVTDSNVSGNLTIESADIVDGTIVNADINGSAAIGLSKLATGALPSGITVASANIVDGTIVNADVNASAAIAGTKISPDFGSQNITTTGVLNCDNINASDNITITSTAPKIFLNDSDTNDDFSINGDGGSFRIKSETDAANRFIVNSDGHVDIPGNLDCGAGVDVTGNITVTGTVDGRDVAADGTKLDGIESGATGDQTNAEIRAAVAAASDSNVFTDAKQTILAGISTSTGVLVNGVTATTQSASDNSTKVATTAYTDTAISNLVDSSPSTLNTLNELAAALGDDANFSTTVTNSIATKMPLSGGTFTGAVTGTTIADSKGDLRRIVINNKTSAYTLVASDAGKAIYISSGGVTVPNAVFSAGDAVTIVNNSTSSQTITQGSNVSLFNTGDAGATGNRTLLARGIATMWFANSSDAYISGSGLE